MSLRLGPLMRSSSTPDRLALARGLGLNLDSELRVTRRTLQVGGPRTPRGELAIYTFGEAPVHPHTPMLLFSHGGSIRPTPALASFGFVALVAAAQARGLPLLFAAVDHRGASCQRDKRRYCLADRVVDLHAARELLCDALGGHTRRLALMGTSMGGHVVSIAARSLCPEHVLLSCPAAYSEEAHFARFGQPFTTALRRPDSWCDSPAFAAIAERTSERRPVVLRSSRFDKVIPRGVTLRYHALIEDAFGPTRIIDTPTDHSGTTVGAVEQLLAHLHGFAAGAARSDAPVRYADAATSC